MESSHSSAMFGSYMSRLVEFDGAFTTDELAADGDESVPFGAHGNTKRGVR